jgi:ATP-dependent Lon protease
MTGEVTLRGRVLPVGGVREKSVAAHRHRIREVLVPRGNARDLAELPPEVRAEVRFHPVHTMDEVLALVLRTPLDRPLVLAPAAPAAPPA